MTHTDVIYVIAKGIARSKKLRYLELGIEKGLTFKQIAPLCEVAYAVDKNERSQQSGENVRSFLGTTDQFFEQCDLRDYFNLVFIDADHKHESSLSDFFNSLKVVQNDGLILLHDTYPPRRKYLSPKNCHDTYKTAEHIRRNCPEVEIVTLPFFCGISIVRKATKQVGWM